MDELPLEQVPASKVDKALHDEVRFALMAVLTAREREKFTDIQERFHLTAGNLSSHLAQLEQAGYVKVKKSFFGKKPQTLIEATPKGTKALKDYIADMKSRLEIAATAVAK